MSTEKKTETKVSTKRVYVVKNRKTGAKRMVETYSAVSAQSHVSKDDYEVYIPTVADAITLASEGVKVEQIAPEASNQLPLPIDVKLDADDGQTQDPSNGEGNGVELAHVVRAGEEPASITGLVNQFDDRPAKRGVIARTAAAVGLIS